MTFDTGQEVMVSKDRPEYSYTVKGTVGRVVRPSTIDGGKRVFVSFDRHDPRNAKYAKLYPDRTGRPNPRQWPIWVEDLIPCGGPW